jgi:aspartate carbamoyltransferase catalytic subunit
MAGFSSKHLLGIKNITKQDIELIFDTADHFKEVINRPIKKVPSLRDITIANLFFENSHAHASLLNWPKNAFRRMLSIFLQTNHLSKKEKHL